MSPRQARRERREAERKARKAELKRAKAAPPNLEGRQSRLVVRCPSVLAAV